MSTASTRKPRVLVACEFSGVVRDAFRRRGFNAWSCDLLPTEIPSRKHIQGDVRRIDLTYFDLLISHPPCTYLCSSGARWWSERAYEQQAALCLVRYLLRAPVRFKALENPIGAISTAIRKPDQIFQPWQFGHAESKATCLWLDHLAPLAATRIMLGPIADRVHIMPQSRDRWKARSRTLPGVAAAMASQWGDVVSKYVSLGCDSGINPPW